jgi:galactose mutarotase-like enzyme
MDPSRSYLHFLVDEEIDAGFIPFGKTSGLVVYETTDHALKISMRSSNEISFQVYHPKGSSFVCIEPLSTKNPRDLNLKSSSISIDIELL